MTDECTGNKGKGHTFQEITSYPSTLCAFKELVSGMRLITEEKWLCWWLLATKLMCEVLSTTNCDSFPICTHVSICRKGTRDPRKTSLLLLWFHQDPMQMETQEATVDYFRS